MLQLGPCLWIANSCPLSQVLENSQTGEHLHREKPSRPTSQRRLLTATRWNAGASLALVPCASSNCHLASAIGKHLMVDAFPVQIVHVLARSICPQEKLGNARVLHMLKIIRNARIYRLFLLMLEESSMWLQKEVLYFWQFI